MVDEPKEVGDCIAATLVRQRERGFWESEVDSISSDWAVLFNPKDDESWNVGDMNLFRIYRITPSRREILVTASNFGFLSISDKMRPRYRNAVRAMTIWFKGNPNDDLGFLAELPDFVSEAKGMFNRCIKQDRLDWFDVWTGLGKPSISDMRRCVDSLTNLRARLRDTGETDEIRIKLREMGVESRFFRFLAYLEQSYSGLTEGPKGTQAHSSKISIEPHGTRPIMREIDKSKLDYANREHRRALAVLSSFLDQMGYYPEVNIFIDMFARLKSGPAIFEVKSINPSNELSQTRHAISQLYEYRYRHSYPDATLWLVLSEKPDTDWLVSYLFDDRKIEVLWVENENLAGPSLGKIGLSNASDQPKPVHEAPRG